MLRDAAADTLSHASGSSTGRPRARATRSFQGLSGFGPLRRRLFFFFRSLESFGSLGHLSGIFALKAIARSYRASRCVGAAMWSTKLGKEEAGQNRSPQSPKLLIFTSRGRQTRVELVRAKRRTFELSGRPEATFLLDKFSA